MAFGLRGGLRNRNRCLQVVSLLRLAVPSTHGSGTTEKTLLASNENPADRRELYQIDVITSDLRGAGTDANVYCIVHGKLGSSPKQWLRALPEAFERGRLDTFQFSSWDLGRLQSVIIGHDGTGRLPSWHLERVVITATKANSSTAFPCGQWLFINKAEGFTERELLPEGESELPRSCTWEIEVHTSDVKGAGTDANVFIQLHGSRGEIGPVKLDTCPENFERGTIDTFHIDEQDIGQIQSLLIGHDNTGNGPAWHVAKIKVSNLSNGASWWFPAEWGRGPREDSSSLCDGPDAATGSI
uniref:Lipoxygenase homology domain-containing protein 1 n=1 Tax=Tetraselmis sp. GSL018 TaxID=582737 RepID=A0A061SAF0_9CHLO